MKKIEIRRNLTLPELKILLVICMAIFSTVIFISCDKEENKFESTAVITGPDVRDCICCGGYFIELNDTVYNFDSLPTSSTINLTEETFPITVNLDWSYDRNCGNIQYIEITRIAKK